MIFWQQRGLESKQAGFVLRSPEFIFSAMLVYRQLIRLQAVRILNLARGVCSFPKD